MSDYRAKPMGGEAARRQRRREDGLHELRHAATRLMKAYHETGDPCSSKFGVALAAVDAALYKAHHGVERPKTGEPLGPFDLTSETWIGQAEFERVEERLIAAWSHSRIIHVADEEAEPLKGVSGPHAALCGSGCKVVLDEIDIGQRQICGDCRRILGEKRATA